MTEILCVIQRPVNRQPVTPGGVTFPTTETFQVHAYTRAETIHVTHLMMYAPSVPFTFIINP